LAEQEGDSIRAVWDVEDALRHVPAT